MLIRSSLLKGFAIQATDGGLGTVDQLYFDDESWAVRYLTVATGGWLEGRQVLVSPISVTRLHPQARRLDVALTRRQVRESPEISTHMPVSRQHEADYSSYYGYPSYWDGPELWGPSYFPSELTPQPSSSTAAPPDSTPQDSHLRCTGSVSGYSLAATDGAIGHVQDFLIDSEVWAIRYIEIATRNWWPGKKVLLSPAWILGVSWAHSNVTIGLARHTIQAAPAYLEAEPVTRAYEDLLHQHYGRAPYWLRESAHTRTLLSPGPAPHATEGRP